MPELILIVVVLALLWLLFIMPQRRRATAQARMIDGLEVGDEILTVGGIFGEVREIDEDEVLVEVAPGTSLRMSKRGIATIVGTHDEPEDETGAEPEEQPLENSESK